MHPAHKTLPLALGTPQRNHCNSIVTSSKHASAPAACPIQYPGVPRALYRTRPAARSGAPAPRSVASRYCCAALAANSTPFLMLPSSSVLSAAKFSFSSSFMGPRGRNSSSPARPRRTCSSAAQQAVSSDALIHVMLRSLHACLAALPYTLVAACQCVPDPRHHTRVPHPSTSSTSSSHQHQHPPCC